MINVKVKTLDSQNHDFTVNEDITVRQFKDHIADTINVPADQQRIIYCGRILNDEKKLKDYDVDGKVVHLVMRPPPGQRPDNSNLNNPQPSERRWGSDQNLGGGRFGRPVDDMFNGLHPAYVTRLSTNGAPATAASGPSLNPSSTLCMNRITVARYMLQCINNIITHLRDPQVPLNNAPMDILDQQTFESTVLEVGISTVSDVDQVQNIMHAFQGAMNAFRQNGGHGPQFVTSVPTDGANNREGVPSIPVVTGTANVQVPVVSIMGEEEPRFHINAPTERSSSTSSSSTTSSSSSSFTTNSINNSTSTASNASSSIDDMTTTATGVARNGNTESEPRTAEANEGSPASRQQTTSTQTLAAVVQEMRDTQEALAPFMQQYYDLLQNDPTFDSEDTAARESAQRIFNRVSEAMHYMSHAQHAISDLMLDMSSPAPRHLCCHPILVEQSAFVSSNLGVPPNVMVRGAPEGAMPVQVLLPQGPPPANVTQQAPAPTPAQQSNGNSTTAAPRNVNNTTNVTSTGTTTTTTPSNATGVGPHPNQHRHHHQHFATIPVIVQQHVVAGNSTPNDIQQLIQSIVNGAAMQMQQQHMPEDQAPPQQGAEPQTSANGGAPRVVTNTMPTTSTQTRSTSRPHVHVTSIPQPAQQAAMNNVRPAAANVFSAFDRFLPCNSHHVQESQRQPPAGSMPPPPGPGIGVTINPGDGMIHIDAERMMGMGGAIPIPIRIQPTLRRRQNPVGNARAGHRSVSANRSQPEGRSASAGPTTSSAMAESMDMERVRSSVDLDEAFLFGVRAELRELVTRRFFNNTEITVDNIKEGVSEIVISLDDLLEPLSNYQHPDYCIRKSVIELISAHLHEMLNLLRLDEPDEAVDSADRRFGTNFLRSLRLLATTLIRILLQSNQRRQDIKEMFQTVYRRFVKNVEPRPMGRIFVFCLKVCMQTLDKKFAANDVNDFINYLVIKRPAPAEEGEVMEVEECVPIASTSSLASTSSTSYERMDAQPSSSSNDSSALSQAVPADWWNLKDDDGSEDMVGTESGSTITKEAWHSRVMCRDRDEQKKITDAKAQPLSDAYLESMTKKRRKTIVDARPTASIPEIINRGVRCAIQSSGFQTQTPVEQIAANISSDVALQNTYREAMHARIRDRLKHSDPNFDPNKFANANNYFK